MTKKKAKRKPTRYTIVVRAGVSYVTYVDVTADNILTAGREAMKLARQEALAAQPDGAELNRVEVEIEDGWREGEEVGVED